MTRAPSRAVSILALAPVLSATLALGACGDGLRVTSTRSESSGEKGVLKVIDALQCPATQGDLTRKGPIEQGGAVCNYVGPRGAQVTLHLVRLDNRSIDQVLADFEARLGRDMPQALSALDARNAPTPPRPPTPPSGDGESASVRAPGMAVDAHGDTASVRLPGLTIDADGDNAEVRIGGIRIDANDDSADINISADDQNVSINAADRVSVVRARSTRGPIRATWTLSDETPSEAGWRLVGYEARGPAGGPIVIAVVRSKWRDRSHVFDDAVDLVEVNVGD